jgi:ATP-binding cassette subfamily B multidrug efflux pump
MFRFLASLADPFAPDDTAPPQGALGFLAHHLKPFRWVIGASLAATIVSAGLEIWLIGYAGGLVDTLAASEPAAFWAAHGLELIGAAGLVLLVRPVAFFFREALDDIAFRPNAAYQIAWRSHRHVLKQPVGWFRQDLAGRIANWVQSIGSAATTTAYSVMHTLSYVAIYIAGAIGLVASIDLQLVIPILVWLALYLGLMVYVVPRLTRAIETYQETYSVFAGLLVDSYANIDTIKLFGGEAVAAEDRQTFDTARADLHRVLRLEVTMNAGMLFLSSLLLVGLIGYAVVLWQAGGAPVGLVAIAVTLSFRITAMAEWLLDAVSGFFSAMGAMRQGLKTVAQPLQLTDAPDATALTVNGGAITFRNVSHHYGRASGAGGPKASGASGAKVGAPEAGAPEAGGLTDVSLTVAAGERVGLVGRSGAGKSTLVNLLLRFYDAEAGMIAIDGQDVSAVTQVSLRRAISMVSQEAALLHRSIRENIAYGRTDVSRTSIEAAASQAQAAGFIATLRDRDGRCGYDAHVGERGITLSGGQRQRIALARAILKDAPILILDEATSALDSEVEAAIQDTLYDLMEGKTVIAIAHRLSTIARMDRIVVLDQGRVAEQGTHAELIEAGGIYAALWARQSGGFLGA